MTETAPDDIAPEPAPEPVAEETLVVRHVSRAPRGERAPWPDVPDLIGLEVLDAHAVARGAGLRLAVSVWETKLGPWGMILSQRPDPGTRVRTGTRIHAVVASRPHLTVPDVRGLPLEAAVDVLRRTGLVPGVLGERASRTFEAGTVIASRPPAGALVVDGSRVALTVSRGRLVRSGRGRLRSVE